MLVEDDDHLRPLLAHRRQDGVELRRLGHQRQRARVRPADHLVAQQHPKQILDVDHAQDVIEIPLVDRIARVRRPSEQIADLLRGRAERNAGQAHARHHDFTGGESAELEQLLQHLSGLGAQRAEVLALLDDELQLLGRVVPGRRSAPGG